MNRILGFLILACVATLVGILIAVRYKDPESVRLLEEHVGKGYVCLTSENDTLVTFPILRVNGKICWLEPGDDGVPKTPAVTALNPQPFTNFLIDPRSENPDEPARPDKMLTFRDGRATWAPYSETEAAAFKVWKDADGEWFIGDNHAKFRILISNGRGVKFERP